MAGLGAAVLAAAAVFAFVCWSTVRRGMEELRAPGHYTEALASPLEDPKYRMFGWEACEYKEEMINILCLGIDGRGEAEEKDNYGFGPRADCIYLASFDTAQHSLVFLNISRDSLVPIRWFDSTGQEVGLYDYQLGLQYTMGNGLDTSCELMEEAVSRMLGGIPIHGYCALYWSSVEAFQEKMGTVEVLVSKELHELDSKNFPECGRIELTPEQAKIFVQGRDITLTGSNELRMERQQMYLKAVYGKLKESVGSSPMRVFELKEAVDPYLVTDLEREELLALAWQLGQVAGTEPELLQVPGVSVETEFQDEFRIDKAGFEEVIRKIFYRDIEADSLNIKE